MALTNVSDIRVGGVFFKPKDYSTALAILFEPVEFQKDVACTDFANNPAVEDRVIAKLSIFASSEDIDNGQPKEILENAVITHGSIVRALNKIMGGATIARVSLEPTKKGNTTWLLLTPSYDGAEAAVTKYYEGREAALAEGMAAAPSFA